MSKKKIMITNNDYVQRINSIYSRKNDIYRLLLTISNENINSPVLSYIKKDLSEVNKEYETFRNSFDTLSVS